MEIKKAAVRCGVKIGEHGFDGDSIIAEISERVLKTGCNFVYIRTKIGEVTPRELFIKWAKFLSENKIYFHFGTHRPPADSVVQFDAELVSELREIAGEYFVGDAISEPGTAMAGNFAGYYPPAGYLKNQPYADCTDMKDASARYVSRVAEYVQTNREIGMPNVVNIEATALAKYNIQAGIDMPILEMMNGNPDELVPIERGAARAYNLEDNWGVLIAHEWYGGTRHSDMLKRKRLELAYKYAYLSGANVIVMESGDEAVNAYEEKYPADSEICADYRRVLSQTAEYAKRDDRPAGGPKAKLAFVSGRHDGWSGFIGSSLWDQFGREEWGYGEAEYSWRILDELGTRRRWAEGANFGENDLSAFPAYGTYDVVPIEAGLSALCRYEYLIFMGWNSMTDEDMENLTEYVRRGGKLLMTAAHLNCNTARNGSLMLPSSEKVEALLGCRFTGKTYRTNSGTKLRRNSVNEEIMYPGADTPYRDPLFSGGFTEYAEVELCGAETAGYLSDSFWGAGSVENFPSVLENRVGKGTVTLVTSLNYPGHPALSPLYRALLREFVSASARTCDVKVIGSERVRYAVYEGGKMYLLNTDYDMPITVKVISGDKEQCVALESLELKTIQI